jgi:hypothetical protein
VRRALEKLPENRPASAEQMLSELEQALAASRAVESGVRLHVAGDDLPKSLRRAERRMWVMGGLLGASLVVVLALVGLVWGRARTITPTPAPITESGGLLENSASNALSGEMSSAPRVTSADATASEIVSALPAESAEAALRPGSSSSTPTARKVVPKGKAPTSLERRGNERYGRFE